MKTVVTTHSIFDPESIKSVQARTPEKPLDTEKKSSYFIVPEGKRINEYEQLCGYTMQSGDFVSGLECGDYQQKHPGGRGAYVPESTELKSHDWFLFRDPDKRWFFPYIKNKAEEGRHTERYMESYSAGGEIRSMNSDWLNNLDSLYGGLIFVEYGLFNAHSSATKDSLSDFIKMWIAQTGFDKNDAAQMIQTQRVFLNKILPSFPADLDGPKAAWMTDPVYQPARETVQELWQGTFDWAEIIWSVHGVFDPIFGQFIRREFFSRLAPLYGDTLTPWFLSQSLQYFETAKKGTKKMMVDVMMEDQHYGDHNRIVINAWTEKWLPEAIKSLKGFMGAYAQLPYQVDGFTCKESVTASVQRVVDDWAEDYAHAINFKVDKDAIVKEIMSGYRQGGKK